VAIISTSRGVMSDRARRKQGVAVSGSDIYAKLKYEGHPCHVIGYPRRVPPSPDKVNPSTEADWPMSGQRVLPHMGSSAASADVALFVRQDNGFVRVEAGHGKPSLPRRHGFAVPWWPQLSKGEQKVSRKARDHRRRLPAAAKGPQADGQRRLQPRRL